MKKIIYSLLGFVFLGLNYVNATENWDTFWKEKVTINPNDNPLDVETQRLISNGMKFLYLIAVIYALWGWFQILTAWWKEEQVKKWRTIIIQAMIGLVVIWLASSIVQWLVWSIIWA